MVGSFEIVRGLKAPKLTQNMEIFSDFDQNYSCLVDEKLSLSRVKIVQHGPLTLCFRQHIILFIYYYLLYCYNTPCDVL